MRPIDDPSSLTPDERFSEVAAILAGGVLRLHSRSALSGTNPATRESPYFSPEGLEVSEETVLSVHCGYRPLPFWRLPGGLSWRPRAAKTGDSLRFSHKLRRKLCFFAQETLFAKRSGGLHGTMSLPPHLLYLLFR